VTTPIPPQFRDAAAHIVRVCQRLDARELIAGQDGNVSVRVAPDRILVTPAGFSKYALTPDDLVLLALDGTQYAGTHAPSSEVAVHLRAYQQRPDVHAVIHAHPVHATAFTVIGETLPHDVLPEVTVLLGRIPFVPYATPGTPEVAVAFDRWWADHDVFLMEHHGALTVGGTLALAEQRMESLEHAARILLVARAAGPVGALPRRAVKELEALHAARRTHLLQGPGTQ
jgi:L-fuculose-phosphate aldolase